MSAIEPPPFLGELRQEFARVAAADADGAGAPQTTAGRRLPRLPRPRLRMQVALPVLAALASLVLATVVVTGGAPFSHDGSAVTQAGRSPEELYAPALLERLDLLRRVHSDDPADAVGRLAHHELDVVRVLSDEAIRIVPPLVNDVSATTLTLPVWAAPTQDGRVAILLQRPDEDGPALRTTADAERIDDNRAFVTVANDLAGLAPNGVGSVTVTIRGGGSVVLPVVDNFFGAHLAARLVSVEWGGMKRP